MAMQKHGKDEVFFLLCVHMVIPAAQYFPPYQNKTGIQAQEAGKVLRFSEKIFKYDHITWHASA